MDDQQRKPAAFRRRPASGEKDTGLSSRVRQNRSSTGKSPAKKSSSVSKRIKKALAKLKYRRTMARKKKKMRKSIWQNSRIRALILTAIALVVILFVVLIAAGAFDSPAQKAKKAEKQQATVEQTAEETIETTEEIETTTAEPKADPNARTVYFTFNAGPSSVTESIMDVLDEHKIKGTFFVRGLEANADLIKEIAERGHVVGVYSAAEDDYSMYTDMDALRNDINTCRQFIYQQTGVLTDVYRFPGGSFNASYMLPIEDCRNILEELDLRYFDWNVESGDNYWENVDAQTIADTVLSGINAYEFKTNVVLFEDADSKTTTAEALDIVIPQLEQDGFAFAGLSATTPEMTFDIE